MLIFVLNMQKNTVRCTVYYAKYSRKQFHGIDEHLSKAGWLTALTFANYHKHVKTLTIKQLLSTVYKQLLI